MNLVFDLHAPETPFSYRDYFETCYTDDTEHEWAGDERDVPVFQAPYIYPIETEEERHLEQELQEQGWYRSDAFAEWQYLQGVEDLQVMDAADAAQEADEYWEAVAQEMRDEALMQEAIELGEAQGRELELRLLALGL